MAIPLSFFRSETSQRLRAEGRLEGRAESILKILALRGVELPEADRARITTCRDPHLLNTWFDRALTATTPTDLFATDPPQPDEPPSPTPPT